MTRGLTNCDLMNRDLLGRVTLPLTGWTARVHQYDGRPSRLVVDPGGGSPLTYPLLPSAGSGQLLLGAHLVRLARPFGPSAIGTVTLAYGALYGEPVEPAFLRHRPWRPARVHKVRPTTLADCVWLAEQAGRFDEIRVTVAGSTAIRIL
ncbi:hypothetical protein [Actinomadura keratinilytica]|jgi:hypothetical protein|uniref:Uncharacterized protein n=1 Tax=Actinomadura keratinilytica TaxID=547461 RepID=A0ABP7Z9S2_9ACTN